MKKALLIGLLCAAAPALAQINEQFEGTFPPAGWSVQDLLPGSPMQWTTNIAEGRDNWTGASSGTNGQCAHADSDHHSGSYDLALLSPTFVVGAGAMLDYDTNYQNYINADFADLDIKIGGNWVNLIHWNEDHGTFQGWPGVHVSQDLSAYAGQSAQLRWHYYEPSAGGYDWWWQVDNVVVTPEPAAFALLGLSLALLRRR